MIISNPKLSIIVPCYNESQNIPLILGRFEEAIGKSKEIELILVNNGSTDNSDVVLTKLLPKYPFARIVHIKVNQGYGFGILSGLRKGNGEFLAWTHADMQTDPLDVVKGFALIKEKDNPDEYYVKGRRSGRPIFDRFFTLGMGVFCSLILGKIMYDINAQPNIIHKNVFEKWKNPPVDFSLDLYAYYMAKILKLKMIYLPVAFSDRLHGHSNWNYSWKSKLKFIKRTASFTFSLRNRLKNPQ